MDFAFQQTLFGRYQVNYYLCPECGLLRTEEPYWLDEVYKEMNADRDIGMLNRNIDQCRFLETFLPLAFPPTAKYLDIAGGYGVLTRLLRDKGFDCYTSDPYRPSLFATAFEKTDDFKTDALFAFEVLEHLREPVKFLEEEFTKHGCRTLVFSTQTFSGKVPEQDWWYYSFETGQHISLYQPRSLAMLAKRLGCQYYMINPGLHVMSDVAFTSLTRLMLTNRYVRKLCTLSLPFFRPKKSLTWQDYRQMKEQNPPRPER